MYVKCEKCGTEYEFDDRKVAASGITVKCTNTRAESKRVKSVNIATTITVKCTGR